MPLDDFFDDDEKVTSSDKRTFFEFECFECNANNPWPDGFSHKDEIHCHYCGCGFQASIVDGKLKLKTL